jgi:hypothetical protein
MSACEDKCAYGMCSDEGRVAEPYGCGGCCGCLGGCQVTYEEEEAERFAREHIEDDLDAILLELRDAGDSLE